MAVKHVFTQTVYMDIFYFGETIMNKYITIMELSPNLSSVSKAHTQYIKYIYKMMNDTKPEHQKSIDISSATMCINTDLNIDLPSCKCVCFCFQ